MEFGASRSGFGPHLLVKNFVQFSVAIISYWLIGFAFSFGDPDSQFIGEKLFGGDEWIEKNSFRCFSYSALVGIFIIYIVNCALLERLKYNASIVFSICLMIFIWPVVVAWTWGGGWLKDAMEGNIIDLGGSITVYTFAGAFALVGALIIGPREGRFSNIDTVPFRMVNHECYIIGSMLTILGVFGIGFAQRSPDNYGYALANMWICGSVSCITSLKVLTAFSKTLQRHYIAVYQGFIAGMVFISSSAHNTTAWESGLHGLMAGGVFCLGVKFVEWVKVDDALNVTGTFLIPGIFGGILPGFIDDDYGVYWAGWESGQVLGTQVVGTITIFLWSIFWSFLVFGIMRILGYLTLSKGLQTSGLSKTAITQKGYAPSVWLNLS